MKRTKARVIRGGHALPQTEKRYARFCADEVARWARYIECASGRSAVELERMFALGESTNGKHWNALVTAHPGAKRFNAEQFAAMKRAPPRA